MSDSEIALLGLLAEKPRYGYELDKIIEQRGMREWTDIAFSSIYAVLRTLEKKGMVSAATEVAGNRVRKLFSITKEGKRVLKESLITLINDPEPPKDPMMLVLANAGILSDDDTDRAFAARLNLLKETKARLSAKLSDNAKSPANVRRMFERSLEGVESEIAFANNMIAGSIDEVASSPAKPAPRNEVARPEPEPEPAPVIEEIVSGEIASEPRIDRTTRQKEKESETDEPMGTLF